MQQHFLAWPRRRKQILIVTLDVLMALFATWAAYSLRTEQLHWPQKQEWLVYLLGPMLAVPMFIRLGLYRAVFRYSGMDSLIATTKGLALYALVHLAILLAMQWPVFPITLGILQPILFMVLVGFSRMFAKVWLNITYSRTDRTRGRTLIWGTGASGVQTAAALQFNSHLDLVGFVDDDPNKVGQTINGIPVYPSTDISGRVDTLAVTDILLAIPDASRKERNRIISSLRRLPVHTRTLPGLADLISGRITAQDFRELDIDDLLGRDVVPPQSDLFSATLRGKTILVTGAGGSIGSELCRQILHEGPAQLLLLDHSEFALYTLHRELAAFCAAKASSVELVPLLASVTNRRRLDWIFANYKPHTVYHAAAYKHVPMVECNPSEGILNNVFGSLNIAQAAVAAGVINFVLVSTDKAVRPTNLMGASKRMSELVMQAMAHQSMQQQAHTTCFSMVRFGNVLGSSGSVIPLFRDQLAAGGPLTVTHPEVTRYFMTIPEAVQLVLQASVMAKGGEVFVLEMGEPVKIIDLAHRLVALSGLQVKDADNPEGDIAITFIGLRPGEKLYEELLIGGNPSPTQHPRIMKAHEDFLQWPALSAQLTVLERASFDEDVAAIKGVLLHCVDGFHEQPF